MLTRNQAKTLALATGLLVAASGVAQAQDSGPLVDLLVKKGIVTDQEGEELKAELVKSYVANTSAGKLNLSSALTEFKMSGDIRLRHQEESQTLQGTTPSVERRRERFRFRFNVDAKLAGGWGSGFALETANAADSGNQTFDNGSDDYNIFLSRAYVSYAPTNDLYFVGGKFVNPLYTTDMVWDGDINTQGLSEAWTINDSLKLVAYQGIMKDNAEARALTTPAAEGRDAWMFAQQLVYTTKFGSNMSLTVAPGYLTYNQSSMTGLSNETAFAGRTQYLELVTAPGEFKLANVAGEGTSVRLYWDLSHNVAADDRVTKIYGLPASVDSDATSYLVGVGYAAGTGKTKGDWQARVDYRYVGIGSIDPNISDSDFAFGNLNQQGYKLNASYNLTDYAQLAASYFYTWDIQGALKQASVAKLDHSQLLQLDLSVKF